MIKAQGLTAVMKVFLMNAQHYYLPDKFHHAGQEHTQQDTVRGQLK